MLRQRPSKAILHFVSCSYLWFGIIVSLVIWTIWKFFIWRDIPERILEQEELMKKQKLLERRGKQEVMER